MLDTGMLSELLDFYKTFKSDDAEQYEHGLFQCIGLKEFVIYLDKVLSCSVKDDDELVQCRKMCLNRFILKTMQYSRIQRKWIRNRLLKSDGSKSIPVYRIDCTHDDFCENALRIIRELQRDKQFEMVIKPEEMLPPLSDEYKRNICTICDNRIFVSKLQWSQHLSSKSHKTRLSKLKKLNNAN
ncbi:hypothetical protein GJ496_001324 [Pomphorhynchus laevis]|nr:hypothetical protein GJ496_001324 [Pomphorhynchus laevis]